ncbi:glycoside hydrolase family 28 protein [Massilia horti]|uniref:Glycoside hydrolase family 28 protein n=1 Tax=Massilia horti TaxID=2562153 RepID=A0A4Y9T7D8_9BURK|nr:glycoside hydrolase family 28 protein [Massilia horti]TFW35084.1 glycoside hydrolase family 28 protein [Massilia horti]
MTAEINLKRRAMLGAATTTLIGPGISTLSMAAQSSDPWQRAREIEAKFAKPLRFRDEDFLITAFGAKPCEVAPVRAWVTPHAMGESLSPLRGSHDCYPAITAAINACHKAGGGRVLITKGNWYMAGPLVLRSNVHVHLAAGARLYFSPNPADYARYGDIDCGPNGKLVVSRWQGNDVLNYSPLVYANGQDNFALTGEDWSSILDGQGGVPFEAGNGCWWDWKGRRNKAGKETQTAINERNPVSLEAVAPQLTTDERELIQSTRQSFRADERYLPALSEAGVPLARRIFGIGHYLRPSMIEFIGCSNILLQGYMVKGSPFWQHHPVNCRNLHIKKVHMDSMGPNNDGFDPESCDTVLVEDCEFNTGDDCIAVKAGRNRDTAFGPTRNVLVQDCVFNSGHGGMTLGSEMAAGIEHVYAQRLEFRNVHWQKDPLNTAIRMKTNMNRGGFLRHFYIRDCTIANGIATVGRFYDQLPGSSLPPNSAATTAGGVITIDCDYTPLDESVRVRLPDVSNVHISNLRVGNVNTPTGMYSCYQAFVILGPLASSYNGPAGKPVLPVRDVTISDCDFGTPRNSEHPWFAHNVKGVQLTNVKIAGKTYNASLDA